MSKQIYVTSSGENAGMVSGPIIAPSIQFTVLSQIEQARIRRRITTKTIPDPSFIAHINVSVVFRLSIIVGF